MQNYVESFVKLRRKTKECYRQNFVETLQNMLQISTDLSTRFSVKVILADLRTKELQSH